MVNLESIFVVGNASILISSIPNIYKLVKTGDIKSFSFAGPIITWFGLTMFGIFYMLNDMWTSFALNTPGVLFWGTIGAWKVNSLRCKI